MNTQLNNVNNDDGKLTIYPVWDAATRWFHWLNVALILVLIALGLVIFNSATLGVTNSGKILLKTLHVWVGYAFTLNLLWRFVWAFVGNRYARFDVFLPFHKGFISATRRYISAFMTGQPEQYLGHNPLGRLSVTLMFILMVAQATTGLVLAGTDLFYPPIGSWIAQWIAADGVAPEALVPYAPALYDAAAYEAMREFRSPYISIHKFNFVLLAGVIVLHIAAVVVTEIREGGNLTSAMFTGKKSFEREPVDIDKG